MFIAKYLNKANLGDFDMFLRKISSIFLFFSLIFFSSCIKYYKLAKEEFNQGDNFDDRRVVSHNNLRTANVQDEFSTLAIFDFLWLSDETREAYVDINCQKTGKDDQAHQAMLRRQLEENKHWITFYVLADIRDKSDGSLSDRDCPWSLYLAKKEFLPETEHEKDRRLRKNLKRKTKEVEKLMPISIKEIDIEPEYRFIFGPKYDQFAKAYEVKFPAVDINGRRYLDKDTEFKIVAASARKKIGVCFNKKDDDEGKILKNEDFYWFRS